MPDLKQRKQAKSAIMAPEFQVGAKAMLEPHGVGDRFRSAFVGWEVDRFVAFKLPLKQELREHLYQDKPIIVRYLHVGGQVCGFESPLKSVIVKPYPLMFLEYPLHVEVVSLRKANRVVCFIPSVVYIEGAAVHGSILDISVGGCRFAVNDKKTEVLPDIGQDAEAILESRLFGTEDLHIVSTVKAIKHEEHDALFLGLAFADMEEELRTQIDAYVQEASRYLGHFCAPESG